MKLEEAMKELEEKSLIYCRVGDSTFRTALKLGIEALKFRQRWEQQEGEPDFPLLPGETEE